MKFDTIVDRYDFLNHLLSVGRDYYWRRVMVKSLNASKGDHVLDLATGTGDSARAIVGKGVPFYFVQRCRVWERELVWAKECF